MRHPRRKEAHDQSDRWLVSYADFMTLLFALFVVLFASSYRDKKSIEGVSTAVRQGFQDMAAFSSVPGSSNAASDTAPRMGIRRGPSRNREAGLQSGVAGIDVVELKARLTAALGKEIEHREIDTRVSSEGFVICLHELGFFKSGEAKLLPGAASKIKRIAEVLSQYDLDMRVEGNSDSVPIHNAIFQSNWELSTARATAVAMMLLDGSRVDPSRLSIAGRGQYHPELSNETPEGRKGNRRVDIVVLSTHSGLR